LRGRPNRARTLFTLDYPEHPALRRQATAELNKGESRNTLAPSFASIASAGSVTEHSASRRRRGWWRSAARCYRYPSPRQGVPHKTGGKPR
jgi:TnpA family transposase